MNGKYKLVATLVNSLEGKHLFATILIVFSSH